MKLICVFVLFLLWNPTLIGQKNFIKLEVTPNTANLGESITVSVKSNIRGSISVNYPSQFKHGYNVMSGMSEEYDNISGKINRISYMSEAGKIDQAGNYTFGPAIIRSGGKTYKSNTVKVTVKTINNTPAQKENAKINAKQYKQPAFGIIEQSKREIYAGEAVLLNAKVYSQVNPTQLENYKTFSFDGTAEKHQLADMNDQITVTDTHLNNTYYYTFSCDKQIIFPSGKGIFKINPFELSLFSGFESIDVTSSEATLKINPLPQPTPATYTGIVGNLALSSKLEATSYKQGSVLQFKLIFTGTGNMQQIHIPSLKLPKQFSLYGDPVTKEDIEFTEKGATGTVIYTYNIQCLDAGQYTLPIQYLSYFDPIKQTYTTLQTEALNLSIEADAVFAGQQRKNISGTMTIREDSISDSEKTNFWQSILSWIGVISLLVLSAVMLLRSKPWQLVLQKPKRLEKSLTVNTSNIKPTLDITLLESMIHAENSSQFYTHLDKVSKQYLRDQSKLPQSATFSEVLEQLKTTGLSTEQLTAIGTFFNELDQARFFVGSSADPHQFLIRLQTISNYFTE